MWAEVDCGPTLPPCAKFVHSTQQNYSPGQQGVESSGSESYPTMLSALSTKFSDEETDFINNDVRTSTHVPFHSHIDGKGDSLCLEPASPSLLGPREMMRSLPASVGTRPPGFVHLKLWLHF